MQPETVPPSFEVVDSRQILLFNINRLFPLALKQRTQRFVSKQPGSQLLAVAGQWPCPCLSAGAFFVFPLTLKDVNSNHTITLLIECRVSSLAKDFCRF